MQGISILEFHYQILNFGILYVSEKPVNVFDIMYKMHMTGISALFYFHEKRCENKMLAKKDSLQRYVAVGLCTSVQDLVNAKETKLFGEPLSNFEPRLIT